MLTTLYVIADENLSGEYFEMYANDGTHEQDVEISDKLTEDDRKYFEKLVDNASALLDEDESEEKMDDLKYAWQEREEEIGERLEKEGYQL